MSSAEENCSSAAAQHALQWLPPLCGISSTGGLQPDDLLLTKQAHSLPTLLCAGAMRSGQLFSLRIVCRVTLCWCTK